ncbi:MAG: HAD-IA family hydrolase [Candidatus Kerfeldbacteria bacterium]|nr:HAD-IA family hydrolase [Candidatus Kerfeldbacteria bacterium]
MRLVLFDVGHVIIRADQQITIGRIQELGVASERAARCFENGRYKDFDRGKISEVGYYEYLRDEVFAGHDNPSLTYENVEDAYGRHLIGVDPTVRDVLESIRHPIAFATNVTPWQTRREQRLIDLTRYGPVIRSHEIGLGKQDLGAFPVILQRLDVVAENVIFIDDLPENVSAAATLGIETILFRDAAQLIADLRSLNVL